MRIFIFSAWIFLGLVCSTWGQGTVDFRNGGLSFPTPADRGVYLPFVSREELINYVAGLWYMKGNDLSRPSLFSDLTHLGREFRLRPATASLPVGWVAPAGVSSIFTFPDVAIGETAVLQVRIWDITKYATFDEALATGQYAASCPFLYTVPPAGSTPDAYYMDNLRQTPGVGCVPEPSTWLVLSAGLFAWVGWRRASARLQLSNRVEFRQDGRLNELVSESRKRRSECLLAIPASVAAEVTRL